MTSTYEFDYSSGSISHAVPTEKERLEKFQAVWDPVTEANLDRLGIEETWHCLELGAGVGSVARSIARRVPQGTLVAADIATGFLQHGPPNMRIVRHDVRKDGFPAESFDLIHARGLLEHLPERRDVLDRILTWLKPGGTVLLESFDATVGLASPHPELRRTLTALLGLLSEESGSDFSYGRRLALDLAEAGFIQVTTTWASVSAGDQGPGEQLLTATVEQLKPALLRNRSMSLDDFHALSTWLETPGAHDLMATLCSVRAIRPARDVPSEGAVGEHSRLSNA